MAGRRIVITLMSLVLLLATPGARADEPTDRITDGRATDGIALLWQHDRFQGHNHFRVAVPGSRVCTDIEVDVWSYYPDGSREFRTFPVRTMGSSGSIGEPFAEGPLVGNDGIFFGLPTGFSANSIIDIRLPVGTFDEEGCGRIANGFYNRISSQGIDASDAIPELIYLL